MKVVALRVAKATLSSCVEAAQNDRILITRHGKPAALVIGVEGEDLEDLLTVANPQFWALVESRRRARKTVPIADVRRRLRTAAKAKNRKPRMVQSHVGERVAGYGAKTANQAKSSTARTRKRSGMAEAAAVELALKEARAHPSRRRR